MPQLEVSAVPLSVYTTDIWANLARNRFCRSYIDDDSPAIVKKLSSDETDVFDRQEDGATGLTGCFNRKFHAPICIASTTPPKSENAITSTICSGGRLSTLDVDLKVRVAANYPAINSVVFILQKACDWPDLWRCQTKLPRLHRFPDRKC